MLDLLGPDGVLALPSAPGPAIPCATPGSELEDWRARLLSLTCIAGLAGLPQVRGRRGCVGVGLVGSVQQPMPRARASPFCFSCWWQADQWLLAA